MAHRGWVLPTGALATAPAGTRGLLYGNRGCLVNALGEVVRHHVGRRWIACVLSYKGRRHPLAAPGRYTGLFFLDEPTALAAGHRPCAECRRADFEAYRRAWPSVIRPSAVEVDEVLHCERLAGAVDASWADLPDGTMVDTAGEPHLLWRGRLLRWTDGGYEPAGRVPSRGVVPVLTPATSRAVLAAGYVPLMHPSAVR